MFGLRLGLLEIEWRVVMMHDNCSVDLTGLRADVARSALRAGPIADLSQALLWLLVVPFAPHSALTLGGLALQYTFWGLTGLASRHGQKLGEPYESDGYKIRELENRVDHGVVAANAPAIDPLVATICVARSPNCSAVRRRRPRPRRRPPSRGGRVSEETRCWRICGRRRRSSWRWRATSARWRSSRAATSIAPPGFR